MERNKEIAAEQSNDAHRALMELPIRYLPLLPLLDRVWELRANVTAYDATYVAAAGILDAPLATLDTKLARVPSLCEFWIP